MAKIRSILFLLAFAFGVSSCSSVKVDENDPGSLMQEAEALIKSDRYQIAIDKLRALKNRFPYSKFSPLAALRIGDVYFLQGSFGEAAISYENFRELYPKHEKASYALFKTAKSYFSDVPSLESRDMGSAYKAIQNYEDLQKLYPGSEFSPEAKSDLVELRERLASKELYVARFYIREASPLSAQGRLKKIVALYPETKAAETAKELLERPEIKNAKAPLLESKENQ